MGLRGGLHCGRFIALFAASGLVFCGCVAPAQGASFNCKLVRTPQEKAICADAKLSALDGQTAAAYKSVLQQLSPEAAEQVRSDERAWLRWRDATCPASWAQMAGKPLSECLLDPYKDQLHVLRSGDLVGGVRFYPRVFVETVPDTGQPTPDFLDPGFGAGNFQWFAIDRPSAVQSAWNKAMRDQVVQLSPTPNDKRLAPGSDFDPKGAADGTFSVSTTLQAANARFISVELDQEEYEYGGAHGGEGLIPFTWWLDKDRKLQPEDIFGPGNAWQHPVAELCWQKLQHGPHAAELFVNGDNTAQMSSHADVDKHSTDFTNWLVDGSGVTVLYQEYSIAPYSSGILSLHLGWKELRPYLAKSFDSAALPQPLPGTEKED